MFVLNNKLKLKDIPFTRSTVKQQILTSSLFKQWLYEGKQNAASPIYLIPVYLMQEVLSHARC